MKFVHTPQKRFGQHFLVDPKTIDKIIRACHLTLEDKILEIGPGKGVLTWRIAPQVKKIVAVEKDRGLSVYLKRENTFAHVEILEEDFLTFDLANQEGPLKVIGNLPYNVATPIIEKIIRHEMNVECAYFMVQLEHGNRMVAQPHSKEYGSLSCFVQYYADVKKLFTIKNTCFNPKPKVESCFLEAILLKKKKFECLDEELLFKVIRAAFNYRRKTLLNSLSFLYEKKDLLNLMSELKIDEKRRAEDLSLKEYVTLVNGMSARGLKPSA